MSVNNDQVLFEITNLSKSFEGTDVLKGISTTVKKGEVLAILKQEQYAAELAASAAQVFSAKADYLNAKIKYKK